MVCGSSKSSRTSSSRTGEPLLDEDELDPFLEWLHQRTYPPPDWSHVARVDVPAWREEVETSWT